MNDRTKRAFGIGVIIAALVGAALLLFFSNAVTHFAEYYLSADHKIRPGGKLQLLGALYFGLFLLALLGAGIIFSTNRAAFTRLRNAFLRDPLYQGRLGQIKPAWVLALSTLVGLALVMNLRRLDPNSETFRILYLEDGLFENLSFYFYFAASLLVGRAAWMLWRRPPAAANPRWLAVLLSVLALGFFAMAGEEISWGQRVFGWSTPEVFATGNVQDETNLHNFFNDIFPLLYNFTALLVVPVLLAAWIEFRGRGNIFSRVVLPHPSLIGLAVLVAFVTLLWGHQEMIEELLALFVFFYSWRLGSLALAPTAAPVKAASSS